ncbi:cell division protein SepF [Floricoccus penangensis]|uniref:cell division protein SepF n=1 Tax=Floricoccus penangensis TaxID=1859475 RepID=UPI000A4952D9|nr:cell division protein SepF [Floricoccus penangensis]
MDNVKDVFGRMRDFFLGDDEDDQEEFSEQGSSVYVANNNQQTARTKTSANRSSQSQEPPVRQRQESSTPQSRPANKQENKQTTSNRSQQTRHNQQSDSNRQSQRVQQQSAPTRQNSETYNRQTQTENNTRKSQDKRMTNDDKFSTIVIKEPRVYGDVMEIATIVKNDESVLVNFKTMDEYQARRSIDFFTGVVYTLDGDIQNVGGQIFLLTPSSVSVEASAEMSLLARQNYDDFDL